MSGSGDAKRDWLSRVLGVSLPEAGEGGATPTEGAPSATPDWSSARQAWQSASDAVDGQISALQSALRANGDETLKQIAEYGLNGVTGNHKVPLMAAMTEIGSGDPAAIGKAGPKALEVIRAFRAHLDGSEEVEVCDDNPFGVAVSIRETLGAALTQMEAALQARIGL